jgi:hypothetical protein
METKTITETGCWLDNHRGHYITRDVIQLAQEFGFIIGQFEQFAVALYDKADSLITGDYSHNIEYPHEAMMELCDDAIEWLNSGQGQCAHCNGRGTNPDDGAFFTKVGDDFGARYCRHCSGTGRGPRIAGQNFPPRVPDGYYWSFNDGDFGLYNIDDEGMD